MTETKKTRQSFALATRGECPEIDRLGIICAVLSQAENDKERARLLRYVNERYAGIGDGVAGENVGGAEQKGAD